MNKATPGHRQQFQAGFKAFLSDLNARFPAGNGRTTIKVPTGGGISWALEDDAVVCYLPVAHLERNLQTNEGAAPFFALGLAFWSQELRLQPRRAMVVLTGSSTDSKAKCLHRRRGYFILENLAAILPDRFQFIAKAGEEGWAWPERPVINKEIDSRTKEGSKREHVLEMRLASNGPWTRSFPCDSPLGRWSRQFPLGLFDGRVSVRTTWTPRGASQVDLWSTSDLGKTLHLFELKAEKNAHVGILAEVFYYALFVESLRTGLKDGRRIDGGADGAAATRKARTVVMWLIAPEFHPLVYRAGRSPLAWINDALGKTGPQFRIMPFKIDDGVPDGARWLPGRAWP
jgi:hypothetical protein